VTSGMIWTLIIGGLLLLESAIVTWGSVARERDQRRLLMEERLLRLAERVEENESERGS